MAASFVVVDQTPVVQVLGANNVLDAMRIEFVTRPSGVFAQRVVPLTAWEDGGSASWVAPLADAIENMIAGGLATDASFVQDASDTTGLLEDAIEFLVTYDPGDGRPVMSAVAVVPLAALTVDTQFGGVLATYFGGGSASLDPQQHVRDVYDQLVATANL